MLTMIVREKPNNIQAINITSKNKSLLDCTKVIADCIYKMITNTKLTNVSAITEIDEKYPMRSAVGSDWIDSQIIYIDNFENVVLNLTKDEFEEIRKGRKFRIVLMRNSEFITKISDHYAAVHPEKILLSLMLPVTWRSRSIKEMLRVYLVCRSMQILPTCRTGCCIKL
jgi:hypothetical protein